MLMFLATVLDEMDLALEHIQKSTVHDARFALMLTDNAVELVLHQIAKDQQARFKAHPFLAEKYQHTKELEEAMGRSFEAKLKFARIEGQLTEEQARTISIMHSFRNELYHLGLQYEAIVQDLSLFYFSTACGFLGGFKIRGFGYMVGIELPERSLKYFTKKGDFSPAEIDDFPKACRHLDEACGHRKSTTIASLVDHMDSVIRDCDIALDIIADGVYDNQHMTRAQATIECQAWPLAFTPEAREFAEKRGWQGSSFEFVEWLKQNYPLKFTMDPIPGWRRQATRLRSIGNPHTALERYHSFMTVTLPMRETLNEASSQVEAEINRLIDERRGK
ncbi:hypothetical protein G6M70_16830 [Agrobacterium tumefaciens]|uniref:hypothetical protein n=1 Tax=Agrobacterium tumefaciens TaxID=358 RepID=UPI00157226A7|nr:hypothetical protein [Agrobacterium tumefaciens]NSY99580.1 hypothetical protein [Agrobacterium tumefaciens]NSZ36333.1 hypothetical protein [Agrobacterium tumefaciens]NTB21849.1 hypothetical protein [Agrobacterium tumefaciens]NTB31805.1 hypothetical protein [Agrobacterium tumefaciens]NTB32172.1 hypothetical protein [Agrobacterium tumefaciens]